MVRGAGFVLTVEGFVAHETANRVQQEAAARVVKALFIMVILIVCVQSYEIMREMQKKNGFSFVFSQNLRTFVAYK